jgi:glycosyltransferase involved in cell wall biosynthesis
VIVRLSLVIPCYNEEQSIEDMFEAAVVATAEVPAEIELLFVDDGSTDGTLVLLRKLAARDSRVRYISLSRNFGKEAAMLAGLEGATGDALVIMDADLQHPPSLLRRMFDLHLEGYDQVVARRDRNGDKFFRSLSSRTFYRLVNKWVDVELLDGVGDFRLLSRRAANAIASMPEVNRFSKGMYSWIGFNTVMFTYRNQARQGGQTKWSFGRLLNYAMDGLLSFNNRPLRAAIYAGLLLTVTAVGYAAWIIADASIRGIDVPGYVTIIASVVGLGGIQVTIMGIIGEYVGRIYYETKRRPKYLTKETEASPPVGPPSDAETSTIAQRLAQELA